MFRQPRNQVLQCLRPAECEMPITTMSIATAEASAFSSECDLTVSRDGGGLQTCERHAGSSFDLLDQFVANLKQLFCG